MTFSVIAGLTSGWPVSTRDTDDIATPARSATSRMLARLRTRKRFSLMAEPPCTVGPMRGLRRKDVLIDRIGGGEWSALRLLPNRPSIYADRRVQIVESGLRCEPP